MRGGSRVYIWFDEAVDLPQLYHLWEYNFSLKYPPPPSSLPPYLPITLLEQEARFLCPIFLIPLWLVDTVAVARVLPVQVILREIDHTLLHTTSLANPLVVTNTAGVRDDKQSDIQLTKCRGSKKKVHTHWLDNAPMNPYWYTLWHLKHQAHDTLYTNKNKCGSIV